MRVQDRLQPYWRHLDGLRGIKSFQVVTHHQSARLDAVLELDTDAARAHELAVVEYRSHLSRASTRRLIAQRVVDGRPLLVLAPHVGADAGSRFADAGINYLDQRGNCHIAVGSLLVHVAGQRALPQPAKDKAIRSAGYQVLFAYLAQPALADATVRVVAEAAGVSRQPVSDMKRRLLESEFIVETKSAVRWIERRRMDALSMWLHGYESTVRPNMVWGTYRTADQTPADLEARIESTFKRVGISEHRWGGCAGGFRLVGHFRGERTVVHVHATPGNVQREMRWLAAADGNLVVMNAFGTINWVREGDTVHPLLVYSEMLSTEDERADEAADEVFERYIKPIWDGAP